jgi:hypothetical protein
LLAVGAPHVLVAVGGLPANIDTVPEFIALIDAVEGGAPRLLAHSRRARSSRRRAKTTRSSST